MIGLLFFIEVQVSHLVHRDEMDMCMWHFETDHRHAYFDTAGMSFDCFGYTLGEDDHLSKLLIRDIEDVVLLSLWDDEGMTLLDRVYVEECEEFVILCNLVTRDFSVDDT